MNADGNRDLVTVINGSWDVRAIGDFHGRVRPGRTSPQARTGLAVR